MAGANGSNVRISFLGYSYIRTTVLQRWRDVGLCDPLGPGEVSYSYTRTSQLIALPMFGSSAGGADMSSSTGGNSNGLPASFRKDERHNPDGKY